MIIMMIIVVMMTKIVSRSNVTGNYELFSGGETNYSSQVKFVVAHCHFLGCKKMPIVAK